MEIDKSQNFSAQLPVNLISNIAYFAVSIIVGILIVPFFVSTLGVAAYGLIPLATSVTGYVAIVVESLNTSVTRFLTIDLRREDFQAANRTFNTALFGLTAVILLMVPIVVAVAFFLPAIFSVPAGQESAAMFLFLGVCGAFLLRTWSGNYTVQLFAYNRLDLQNIVNLTNLMVQYGLIVLLFIVLGPNLAIIGGAAIVGAVFASALSIILARNICPQLRISLRDFDRLKVRDLLGMGSWVIIDQVGTLFLFSIDLIVVNILFGATSAGEYAIAQQWGLLLRSISSTLANVVLPTILGYYALKRIDSLVQLMPPILKFMGLAMALPAGLICGFAPQLLAIWVGPEYSFLAPLMVLLTAPLAIIMAVQPLFAINVAYNKVRIPGIMTIIFGAINLLLAIGLSLATGLGYYGVAVAGVITLTIRHTLFVPWYAARIQKLPGTTYMRFLFSVTLALTTIGLAAASITYIMSIQALLPLAITGSIIAISYGIIVLRFGLTPFERQLIISTMPRELQKIVTKMNIIRSDE